METADVVEEKTLRNSAAAFLCVWECYVCMCVYYIHAVYVFINALTYTYNIHMYAHIHSTHIVHTYMHAYTCLCVCSFGS